MLNTCVINELPTFLPVDGFGIEVDGYSQFFGAPQ